VDGIDPGDELMDVVDDQDRVVGQATRREVRRRRLLHRFASVLCRDPAGRIYVHRRTDDKDVYPGMYDMTAGGVLAARARAVRCCEPRGGGGLTIFRKYLLSRRWRWTASTQATS